MSQNKERVLKEVSAQLAEKLSRKPKEAVDILRRFRKLEEHRLRIAHYAGGGGREVCRQRSDVIDILFRRLFETVSETAGYVDEKNSLVMVAFGGYGRRELNPASDVDIMFILNTKNPT
ncbi:MAG: hypothetical protein ABI615_04185, partial [Chthoniobacterales bacterium]